MTGKTHMLIGVTTAIAVQHFTNFQLTSREYCEYYTLCTLGSILPDIDHPHAILNKMFLELPYLLTGKCKHRTKTHSLLFLVGVTLTFFILSKNLVPSLALGLGIMSHLVADTLNPTGVPYLYPFDKEKYRIAKIRTGTSAESIIAVCCVLLIYLIVTI